MRVKGLLSFPLTPFGDEGNVNLPALRDQLKTQLQAEPSALFVACGTGEFSALSTSEYREVVGTAVDTVAGRVLVMAGAGGGPEIARTFATEAHRAGADGLLLLPPYLVGCPPAGLLAHIKHVAAATPLPVMVYQRANAILDPTTAVALLDIDNVIGIKDGQGDVDAMHRLINAVRHSGHPRAADFQFMNGLPTAELSAHAYQAIGVDSYSSAVLCFAPDIATAFRQGFREQDRDLCDALVAEFYAPFAKLRDTTAGYAVSLVKAGARLGGAAVGSVRPPLVDPSDEHLDQLAKIIAAGRDVLRGRNTEVAK